MSVVSIILLVAIVFNAVLGLFIFLGKSRSASNICYFILILFLAVWMGMNFLVDFVHSQFDAWLLSVVAYVSILGIGYTFLLFCYYFPKPSLVVSLTLRILALLGAIAVGTVIFVPGVVIESIVISPWKINTGPGLGILFLGFIALMLAGFAILRKKSRSPQIEAKERSQLRLVLVGTILTTVIGSAFNMALPFLTQNYDYVRVGPISTLILLVCIAVAIVKYQLFNLKVVATQTFSVVLCAFLFIRAIATDTLSDQIVNGALFVLTATVCVFLVRSVLKEVEQREALAKANEGQKNLIHIISHQIKGFLAKNRNIFSELLTEPAYGPISEGAKPLLAAGLDSLTEGVNLTQQLLNASSVESGTMQYFMEPLDFKQLVTSIVSAHQSALNGKPIVTLALNVDPGEYKMTGDNSQLKEALRNLVDNAIHYTPSGNITVALTHRGSALLLSVKDNGIGLTDDDKKKLFTKGGRGADSLKVNVNSTGYGLFFVKGVIDAHHGRVWAESAGRGTGSTFFVELPVSSNT